MEFHNPGYFLKPGMFATVELLSELAPSALLVPDIGRPAQRREEHGVRRAGRRAVSSRARWRSGRGRRTTLYQVLSGLSEGERIVTSGQFMLDSESQLREAIQKMMRPKARGETGGSRPGHRSRAQAAPATHGRPPRRRPTSSTSARCRSTSPSNTITRASARSAA